MNLTDIKRIGVCGAGTMGAGIAQVFAQSGFDVVLFDLSKEVLLTAEKLIAANLAKAVEKNKISEQQKNEVLSRISFIDDLKALKADLVIEAIVEKLEVKEKLFAELAAINNVNTIFASNTSSLSITAIAKSISNSKRFVGLHFFNPAHLMNLVEIIQAVETSDETIMTMKELCAKIGKTAVVCKNSPGFIVNRVARNFYTESLQILEDNAAKMENIDALLESAGFKMGPFKLMDTIGNDINFAVTSSLYNSFHQVAKFRPSRIQEQNVVSGNLGKKTGKGFYNYE